MSKKHRKSGSAQGPEGAAQGGMNLEGEFSLSNAALQDQLAGGDRVASVGFDVLRDMAVPRVERALLALGSVGRGAETTQRYVEILRDSRLPVERKELLTQRVQNNEAIAQGIEEAVERWFGPDSEALRDALTTSLDGVWRGLEEGTPANDGAEWSLPDGAVALPEAARIGEPAQRVESLLGVLGQQSAVSEVAQAAEQQGHTPGAALMGLVRDVFLLIGRDEEEEEWATAPVGVEG